MTREEALRKAEGYLTLALGTYLPLDNCKEVDEIIEALKQESSEDCIARQPLIDNWNSCADMLMDEGDAKVVMGWIFDAPPVTPTRKAGKWTPGESICSCCGEDKFKDLDADIWSDWQPKYCPNCGAEMEGEIRNDH